MSFKIADAEVLLLVKYLNMAKNLEWKSQKEPEFIDLASDDEDIEDASVVIIDLDGSDCPSAGKKRKIKTSESILIIDNESVINTNNKKNSLSDLVPIKLVDNVSRESSPGANIDVSTNLIEMRDNILDTKETEKSLPIPTSLERRSNDVECSLEHKEKVSSAKNLVESSSSKPYNRDNKIDEIKCSNKQSKKRKRGLEKGSSNDLEFVEILDDDVIVIDDSLLVHSPSLTSGADVLVIEPEILPKSKILPSENLSNSSRTSSPNPQSLDNSQPPVVHQHSTKSSDSESDQRTGKTENASGPSKKKSKLSYHRPAHLVTPLTKPNLAIPSKNTVAVTNIYNPNADSSEKRTGLRPIVIDGNNVALGHGKGTFSLKGLKICVNFFEKRGHRQIKVFVPHYRRNRTTHDELKKMENDGLVVITPSRKVNGKVVASYDDRYIVQYAAEFGGIIVSTDNYRDLLQENSSWKETIEKRLLMFTWVDDLLMFPQDPLGRNGPSLDEFLKFPDT